jgi:hypothetical protein
MAKRLVVEPSRKQKEFSVATNTEVMPQSHEAFIEGLIL